MDTVFFELFESLPRQAPGSARATLRALSSLTLPPRALSILDIGCGAGAQTLTLARHLTGNIVAVDNHQPFLDALATRTAAAVLRATVECRNADMRTLAFPDGSIDIVWAEGSLFIMGFEAALRMVRPFLTKGGYVVFSDMVWLTEDPPAAAVEFFAAEYPAMMRSADLPGLVINGGYTLIDSFPVLVEDHWKTYYEPMQEQVRLMRAERRSDPAAQRLCDALQHEIDIYASFSSAFGYVFTIMQRP
jgi:ubiquinone/menaquinone biosynthesis C-methylase UbiE